MSISSATEIECLKKAYLRDGVSFVRFLAWLNVKLAEAYCNEDALLVELRRKLQVSQGFSGEQSQNGAALPHYPPTAAMISWVFLL
jgi:Xaa-Pro aminopeptidase